MPPLRRGPRPCEGIRPHDAGCLCCRGRGGEGAAPRRGRDCERDRDRRHRPERAPGDAYRCALAVEGARLPVHGLRRRRGGVPRRSRHHRAGRSVRGQQRLHGLDRRPVRDRLGARGSRARSPHLPQALQRRDPLAVGARGAARIAPERTRSTRPRSSGSSSRPSRSPTTSSAAARRAQRTRSAPRKRPITRSPTCSPSRCSTGRCCPSSSRPSGSSGRTCRRCCGASRCDLRPTSRPASRPSTPADCASTLRTGRRWRRRRATTRAFSTRPMSWKRARQQVRAARRGAARAGARRRAGRRGRGARRARHTRPDCRCLPAQSPTTKGGLR